MRKFIIGLAVLFFILAGIVTYKALGIHANNTSYQNTREKSGAAEDISDKLAKEQAVNRDLQAAITTLRDELANKNEVIPKVEPPKMETRVLAVLDGKSFGSGQIVADENVMQIIHEIVPDILAASDYRVIIEGHTSSTPVKTSADNRYNDNMELSLLRANAVASILVNNGIPVERIQAIGLGDTQPVDSNDTYEGRVKNRRVEIKLISGEKER